VSGLPQGWGTLNTKDSFDLVPTTGKNIKTKETSAFGKYPVIDQGQKYICGYIDNAEKLIEVEEPIIIFGDHTRIFKWVDFSFVPGADGTKVLSPKVYLNRKFFYYQLKNIELPDKGYSRHFKFLKASKLKLAPLNEQIRIANKLDSLLGKLEATQKHLDKIPSLLKRFRQSVLAAAVSGELLEDKTDWENVILSQVADSRLGKMLDKNKNKGEYYPYLRNINIRWFDINLTDIYEMKVTTDEIKTLSVNQLDVLVCEGGEPGRCAIWKGENGKYIYQKALHRVRVKSSLLPEWLCYVFKSAADSGRLKDYFTGTTIKHFTGMSLKSFKLELPTIEEQKQIVHQVESLFKLADKVEQQYQAAKQRTDKLTQSILTKAFCGELVPQDPNDEPACELLKRIKAAKA